MGGGRPQHGEQRTLSSERAGSERSLPPGSHGQVWKERMRSREAWQLLRDMQSPLRPADSVVALGSGWAQRALSWRRLGGGFSKDEIKGIRERGRTSVSAWVMPGEDKHRAIVMADPTCPLGQDTVSGCSVKCLSRCGCEGTLR